MKLIFVVPLIYFIVAFFTLPHFGINWDEPFHFNRGWSYLHFFLTGEKNYLNLPEYPKLIGSSDFMGREGESELYLNSKSSTKPTDPAFRRSYYESDVFNFEYFAKFDGRGHPPANDILAAFFNYIFYQKLGLLGDIEAYHLFEITTATLLIIAVAYFTYYHFGVLAALVASFSLAAYPLFFAESHFNIKDPVQASFFGLTIITFYFGVVKQKWQILFLSAILAGLSLGSKFNAVFLPFITVPWLIYYYLKEKKFSFSKKIIISLTLYPVVATAVFYIFWPYLWGNPIKNLLTVVDFYITSGTSAGGFNLFPLTWMVITTPLPILLFSLMGLIFAVKNLLKTKQSVFLLIILWLLIPILRVSAPATTIHGGVRHIMEFIPAMAILAGIGSFFIINLLKRNVFRFLFIAAIIFSAGFITWELIRLHPNENVYFNQLIGGLPGAKVKNIPYWGNSYGNVYLQGVDWINQNAPKNAKLSLPIFNMVNVPRVKLRPDINFSNAHFSGPARAGEYSMEMSHNFNPNSWYAYDYLDKFLMPVYEVKVDGVAILKIWKNDDKYLKEEFKKEGQEYDIKSLTIKDSILNIDIGQKIYLTKLEITHKREDCQTQKGGYIRLSVDGKSWKQESETIDYPQIPIQWIKWDKKNFIYLFSAKEARFIFLDTQMLDSCLLQNPQIKIFGFF